MDLYVALMQLRSARLAEERRMLAMTLLRDGRRQIDVAHILQVSRVAIHQWKTMLDQEGAAGLRSKAHPGPPVRLSDQQQADLERRLLKRSAGRRTPQGPWTLEQISQLIAKHYGQRYDVSGVWHLLQRMGWRWQYPEHGSGRPIDWHKTGSGAKAVRSEGASGRRSRRTTR